MPMAPMTLLETLKLEKMQREQVFNVCGWLQDIFSMGCVIAELFMEGKALFDLSKVQSALSTAVLHFLHYIILCGR